MVRLSSFFSCRFITAIVVNPPERKLAKRTSVQWRITIRRRWLDYKRVCIETCWSNFTKINLNLSFHPINDYFSPWVFEQNSLIWPSVGYLAQWRITIRRRWLDDGRVCVVTRRSNFPKINLCRATHLTLLTRRRRRLAASEIRRRRRRRRLFAEWRNWATAAGSCGHSAHCSIEFRSERFKIAHSIQWL